MSARHARALGDALAPTIDRLRDIVTISANAMITEGPVSPDRVLLDACAEALALFREAERLRDLRVTYDRGTRPRTPQDRHLAANAFDRLTTAERTASGMLVGLRKHAARTAAGIYAKALVVKSSKTGAADLARSLAEDLIANDVLRRVLWETDVGDVT
jgi:hypothetical protein